MRPRRLAVLPIAGLLGFLWTLLLPLSPVAQTRPLVPGQPRGPRFIGLMSGGVDGTYVRIAADIAAVLDDPPQLRVVPMLGKGSVQNIDDLLHLPGVDLAVVQSDVLAFIRKEKINPGAERNVGYVAKLYEEEVHILAGPDVKSIADLRNRAVNVDVRGSGTALTATTLFDALGIPFIPVNDDGPTALYKLRRGEVAALMYVAGKPTRLFSGVEAGSGLHFLSVPLTPALLENYVPTRLGTSDYPALVDANGEVQTVAVGAVLAAFLWPPGTEGRRRIETFQAAFTSKFSRFREPQRHPKWRDVNLAAEIPGWLRIQPAAKAPVIAGAAASNR